MCVHVPHVQPLKNIVTDMNDRRIFILFADRVTDPDAAAQAIAAFEVAAEDFVREAAAGGDAVEESAMPLFAYADEDDEVAPWGAHVLGGCACWRLSTG